MTTNQVKTEIDERGVATVTLNRPDKHNAFGAELIGELTEKLKNLTNNGRVRVVVLTGSGETFSSGADLHWMRSMVNYSEQENLEDALRLAELLDALSDLPKPAIARINGSAFGGALGLISCCDIAVCVPSARFALSEVRLGLAPAVISPYVITAIGSRQARRFMQSAERFDAATAKEIGLVHVVAEEEGLDAAVDRQIAWLLKAGPNALAASKQLTELWARHASDRERLRTETAKIIARLRVSNEGQEGVNAFLEKRNPRWDA